MKHLYVIISTILLITIVVFLSVKVLRSNNNLEKNNSNMEENLITLPEPVIDGKMSVEQALHLRRSVRSYADIELTIEQVSQLLWATYGVTKRSHNVLYKTAPSAGATYPLEIYLFVGKVKDIGAGLYRYLPETHSLKLESKGDVRQQLAKACLEQRMIEQAPVTIIFSVVAERISRRYGDRGKDRYICMDIGHAAQNLYLQATAMGLATCAVGAFRDEELHEVISVPAEEQILYLMPVGYAK
jgi:SagB-type dehydrogenase family enzyme